MTSSAYQKKIQKIKVGSRGSRLALAQVEEVFSLLEKKGRKISFEIAAYQTRGDLDKTSPLSDSLPDDFFTDALDRALGAGEIDVAVHSAKDLPKNLPGELKLFALTPSLDETDAFVGPVKISELKKGAKVGTSSPIRKEAITTLNPNITPVNIRGTIEERIALVEQGALNGVIIAACALKRLALDHLIADIMPYETTPLQGQLAVVGCGGDSKLEKTFVPIDARQSYGKVWLVGAGPGDPDLITLKAIKILQAADVVFYDFLVNAALLNYCPQAEKIYVGKRKGAQTLAQSELSRMLRQKATAGKNVVRLKGGDPLIFGRGADEINYLRSYHIEVGVIPGVSSATGIPSALGIPLTARGISSSVAFISGHSEDEETNNPQLVVIPKSDTIVFLMGLTKLNWILRSLRMAGWGEEVPMIIISKGTCADQRIVYGTIGTIEQLAAGANLQPPALMVVGKTVTFWRPRNPQGETILYVGTNPEKYKALGNIVHLPTIEITPLKPPEEFIKNLESTISQYQIIIVTSRFAVRYFMKILEENNCLPWQDKRFIVAGQGLPWQDKRFIVAGQGLPAAGQWPDFAVVGKDTADELRRHHIAPKVVADMETSDGLLQAIAGTYALKGKNILFPRSSLPNPYLKDELTKRGAQVFELAVYENKKPPRQDASFDHITKVLFTSPSTVKNFLADYGIIPQGWQILSKGPLTQQALKKAGYESEVLVYEQSIPSFKKK